MRVILSDKKPNLRRGGSGPGLDVSKRALNSQFRLPVQARVKSQSFFNYYEDGREFLNAIEWIVDDRIQTALEMEFEPEEPVYKQSEGVDQARVDVAIAQWQSTEKGHGHTAFFQLAVDVRGAGMGAAEIKSTLRSQAQFARSKSDRLAEIPHIMRSLREESVNVSGLSNEFTK